MNELVGTKPDIVSIAGLPSYIYREQGKLPQQDKALLEKWCLPKDKQVPPEFEAESPIPYQEQETMGKPGCIHLIYKDPLQAGKEFAIPVWLGRATFEKDGRKYQSVSLHLALWDVSLGSGKYEASIDSKEWDNLPEAAVHAADVFNILEEHQPEKVPDQQAKDGMEVEWSRHFTSRDGTRSVIPGMEVERNTTKFGQTWESFSQALEKSTKGCMKLRFSEKTE